MSDLVYEAWPLPGAAVWEKKVAGLKFSGSSYTNYRRQVGTGTATLTDESRLDEVIDVDPANHANDVGSLIRVWRPARGSYPRTLVAEWLVEDTPDQLAETGKTLSGAGVETVMGWADVFPWDWDGTASFVSAFPDWIYGGTNVISDPSTAEAQCEPRISEFWTNATSGNWRITVDGNSVDVAYNVTASALTTAYEGLATVNDVAVEGNGSEATPWRVTFVDPCFPTTYSVSQHTLNDTLQAGLIQQGSFQVAGWTEARPLRGNTLYGEYASFGYATLPAASPAGSTSGIGFDGLTPVGFSFPGAQTTPRLTPGGLYQGGVWVYVDAAGSYPMRLVLRTDTEEPLIADSGWPSTTVTGQTWTLLSFVDAQNFDWTTSGIFRVSYVGTANPPTIYVADAYLTEGMPPDTVGQIMLDLLADCQTDHAATREALLFVNANFSASLDSAGNAWPRDEYVSIPRGVSYRRVLDQIFGSLGYEWSLTPSSTDGEWDLNIWYQDRGTDYSAAVSPSLLIGQGTVAGTAQASLPRGNAVMAEGANQRFYIDTDTSSIGSIGRRETYVGDVTYFGDLSGWAGTRLAEFLDESWAPAFTIADSEDVPVPGVAYGLGDTLTVKAAGKSVSREVEAVGFVDSDEGLVWRVMFGAATFGGTQQTSGGGSSLGALGPVAEGVRRLLEKQERLPDAYVPFQGTAGGSGGMLPISIVSTSEPVGQQERADYVIDKDSSAVPLQSVLNGLDASYVWTIWLEGSFNLDGADITWPENCWMGGLGYKFSSGGPT